MTDTDRAEWVSSVSEICRKYGFKLGRYRDFGDMELKYCFISSYGDMWKSAHAIPPNETAEQIEERIVAVVLSRM